MLVSSRNFRSRGCRTCIARKVKVRKITQSRQDLKQEACSTSTLLTSSILTLTFQCDQTRPACLRCTRTNRECGKYRDQHDLVFRSMQIQPPMEQSWEQLVIPFFFANHTIAAARGRPGHLDFIPELYGKSGSSGDCFQEALLAVSAGHLARYRHDAVLNERARLLYGKALSSLRLALSDERSAQQNGIVTAMLLLSRFEVSPSFVEHVDLDILIPV